VADRTPADRRGALIGWHEGYEASHHRLGAVTVDATRPLARVVDGILVACTDRLPP
jgi:hypothetical protein